MAWRPLALVSIPGSSLLARLRRFRRINLTYGRRVFARLHLDSAFGGEGSGGETILRIGFESHAIHRSPTRIGRG
jgi:hypothetical protein